MLYVMEVSESKLKIVFSSVLKNISEVIEDTIEFLTNINYSYESFSLKLAMAEGLANSVKHGNAFNPKLNTTFTLEVITGKIVMCFEDEGEGFDWKLALQSELPNERQTSGRGLFLLKEYGYKVMYNESGNKLSIVKA